MALLFWLLVGHGLCDWPLQGDFMAKAKNHLQPIPGAPFYWSLGYHALIHAGAVAFITRRPSLAIAEFVLHAGIDWLKCDKRLTFDSDQVLHVLCKVAWASLVVVL